MNNYNFFQNTHNLTPAHIFNSKNINIHENYNDLRTPFNQIQKEFKSIDNFNNLKNFLLTKNNEVNDIELRNEIDKIYNHYGPLITDDNVDEQIKKLNKIVIKKYLRILDNNLNYQNNYVEAFHNNIDPDIDKGTTFKLLDRPISTTQSNFLPTWLQNN